MSHKYHAKGTWIDGHFFPSQAEAKRYRELLLLQRIGIVTESELQPKFLLQEGFVREGKVYRPITYRADFRVTYADGHIEVEDVKGYRTKEFDRTEKLLLYRYPDIRFNVLGGAKCSKR